jgi:hypothetical protein
MPTWWGGWNDGSRRLRRPRPAAAQAHQVRSLTLLYAKYVGFRTRCAALARGVDAAPASVSLSVVSRHVERQCDRCPCCAAAGPHQLKSKHAECKRADEDGAVLRRRGQLLRCAGACRRCRCLKSSCARQVTRASRVHLRVVTCTPSICSWSYSGLPTLTVRALLGARGPWIAPCGVAFRITVMEFRLV